MDFYIPRDEEEALRKRLEERADPEAMRMKRYLAMPDLSRSPESPLHEIVARVKEVPALKGFDDINIPEIVPASVSFDLFNFPADHPARSPSDTYYVDRENILRTHDTVFWYYYLRLPDIAARVAKGEPLGALCYGKVYRKDEIDRRHMNIFHQMGGWYLMPDTEKMLTLEDLKAVLSEVVKSIFGAKTVFRFNADVFPYTDPSLEVEVKVGDEWVEILGGGMPKKEVLAHMGLCGYNGWAFGFGLERLAIISMKLPDIRLLWSADERVKKQLMLGRAFQEVSKYPPAFRDISFVVRDDFIPNDYFDLVRDIAGDFVEEVTLTDKYENEEKFGKGRISYTYHLTYRSTDKTLTGSEVDALHRALERATREQCSAEVR